MDKLMLESLGKASPFCEKTWTEPTTDGTKLCRHYCYLNKGHEGNCVCGFCDMYGHGEEHLEDLNENRQ